MTTTTTTATTKAVLDRHTEALFGGDVDRILADYALDAVLVSTQNVLRGHDALRAMFTNIPPGSFDGFEITKEMCDGEVAVIEWTSKHVSFGTDTFVLRDGKIAVQTVAHK